MSSELTRDEFKNWLLIYYERSSDGRNLEPAETTLLAHDAALRQRVEALEQHLESQRQATYQAVEREHAAKKKLEACERERDQWKDKHEYLDYFFNSAITERNELRVAKQSLIDTKKALQRQLQQRDETIVSVREKADELWRAIQGALAPAQVENIEVAVLLIRTQRARLDVLEGALKAMCDELEETSKTMCDFYRVPIATREKGEC